MESSPAFTTFSTTIREAIDKFTALIEQDETLFNQERLTKFFETSRFGLNYSDEELAQSILNKTFHEKFMEDGFLQQIFKYWEKLSNATTKKETTSRVSVTVGSETPEIQKNQINIELLSDTIKQTELLNKHLSTLNPDVEVPFVAVKLYSATPNETRDFRESMLQMVNPLLESAPLPFVPEISVVAGSDHVIVQVTAKKSVEVTFFMIFIGHLIAKLPEYDVELRLNVLAGTNFRHLIQNHTDNTVFDLLNGFKISLEFKNNLAGFLDELVPLLLEQGKNSDSLKVRALSFALGSVSLNTELNLNLGANELALMANLPKVNIFDKEGILSAAPLGQAKAMREDEMGQMILPNLNSLEGKAEIFVSCPFLTFHLNVDASGALELANSTIDLFSD
jgi:hypothetical protein